MIKYFNYRILYIACFYSMHLYALSENTSSTSTPFSTLFTSKQERSVLDSQRTDFYGEMADTPNYNQSSTDILTSYEDKIENDTPLNEVMVSGMIIRSDGTKVVWINGKQIDNNNNNKNTNVTFSSTKSEVLVNEYNKKKILKPGQVWNLKEGKVTESYLHVPEVSIETTTIIDETEQESPTTKSQSSIETLKKVKETNETTRLLLQNN